MDGRHGFSGDLVQLRSSSDTLWWRLGLKFSVGLLLPRRGYIT
uniref:Uncharacterized protein n=1 Tax=Candidatus Kentrum sp. DK TaxID=2126562 RepID=A0A450TJI5_9GAMM|nr:MAG: hypothetical protein BECKDK2373C_GA0170839_11668 [Candidatus Kentron sp. DK]